MGVSGGHIRTSVRSPLLILAIETSTNFLSVALLRDSDVVGSYRAESQRTHAERLVPEIRNLLEENELGIDDLDAIAVSQGPGSYTGLRIGIATAKGYALARKLPLMGVSTFISVAHACPGDRPVLVLIRARQDEWFYAVADSNGGWVISDQGVDSSSGLSERFRDSDIQIASTATLTPAELADIGQIGEVLHVDPDAILTGRAASVRLASGDSSDLHNLEPNYGRDYFVREQTSAFARLEQRLSKD